jgi:hypothetical protein
MAATVEPAPVPAPAKPISRDTRYVVLHTMVGSGQGTALQSDVVLPKDMGIEGDPVDVQKAIDRLVALGAIRPLWDHEYETARENMEGDVQRLPGVRYEGAVAPQQGIREGLAAQAEKQLALMRQAAAKQAEEKAKLEEQVTSRQLLLSMAQMMEAQKRAEAAGRRLAPGVQVPTYAVDPGVTVSPEEQAIAAPVPVHPTALPEPGDPDWHELEKQTAPPPGPKLPDPPKKPDKKGG